MGDGEHVGRTRLSASLTAPRSIGLFFGWRQPAPGLGLRHERLKGFGRPVQYSVFECLLEEEIWPGRRGGRRGPCRVRGGRSPDLSSLRPVRETHADPGAGDRDEGRSGLCGLSVCRGGAAGWRTQLVGSPAVTERRV